MQSNCLFDSDQEFFDELSSITETKRQESMAYPECVSVSSGYYDHWYDQSLGPYEYQVDPNATDNHSNRQFTTYYPQNFPTEMPIQLTKDAWINHGRTYKSVCPYFLKIRSFSSSFESSTVHQDFYAHLQQHHAVEITNETSICYCEVPRYYKMYHLNKKWTGKVIKLYEQKGGNPVSIQTEWDYRQNEEITISIMTFLSLDYEQQKKIMRHSLVSPEYVKTAEDKNTYRTLQQMKVAEKYDFLLNTKPPGLPLYARRKTTLLSALRKSLEIIE